MDKNTFDRGICMDAKHIPAVLSNPRKNANSSLLAEHMLQGAGDSRRGAHAPAHSSSSSTCIAGAASSFSAKKAQPSGPGWMPSSKSLMYASAFSRTENNET